MGNLSNYKRSDTIQGCFFRQRRFSCSALPAPPSCANRLHPPCTQWQPLRPISRLPSTLRLAIYLSLRAVRLDSTPPLRFTLAFAHISIVILQSPDGTSINTLLL